MNTAERAAEDIWHVEGMAKGTQIIWKNCLNETKWPNCQENYPAFSRYCDIQKKKEIMKIKYKRNISSFEAKKIVESYIMWTLIPL